MLRFCLRKTVPVSKTRGDSGECWLEGNHVYLGISSVLVVGVWIGRPYLPLLALPQRSSTAPRACQALRTTTLALHREITAQPPAECCARRRRRARSQPIRSDLCWAAVGSANCRQLSREGAAASSARKIDQERAHYRFRAEQREAAQRWGSHGVRSGAARCGAVRRGGRRWPPRRRHNRGVRAARCLPAPARFAICDATETSERVAEGKGHACRYSVVSQAQAPSVMRRSIGRPHRVMRADSDETGCGSQILG